MMARYKFFDTSPRLLPVVLEDQLVPGSFAHAMHHLVDTQDLSGFNAHYRNDANGATAHAPAHAVRQGQSRWPMENVRPRPQHREVGELQKGRVK